MSSFVCAWNPDRNCCLGTDVLVARNSRDRRVGLLRHSRLLLGSGLWIPHCEAIHTFRMNFPIDVIFLHRDHRVLKLCQEVGANRIRFCLQAYSVLELPSGTIATSGTRVHDRLEMGPSET